MAPRLFGFLYFEKFPQITPPKIRLRRTLLGPSAFMVSTKFCKCLQKHPQISSNFLIRSLSPRLRISTNFLNSIPKFPHQKPVPRLRISTNFLKIIQISSSEPCPLVSGFPQISSKTPPYFACGGFPLSPRLRISSNFLKNISKFRLRRAFPCPPRLRISSNFLKITPKIFRLRRASSLPQK